jgi:PmbA protein
MADRTFVLPTWSSEDSLEVAMMTDIGEIAERTVRKVARLGASHCDVVAVDSKYVVAEIEKSSTKQASVITDSGIGIRAFWKGASGFAYTTGFDSKEIDRIAKLAVSQAKVGTPDPDFRGLPGRKRATKVEGLYESKIERLQPEHVVDLANQLSDAASSDRRIVSVNAGAGAGSCRVALANSEGFSGFQKLTSLEMSVESVARTGSRMFSGLDGVWNRRLDKRSITASGENAMDIAIRGLRSKRVKTGDYPVVLDSLSCGFILLTAVGGGVDAESIQRKRSYLTGQLGKTIAAKTVTVWDDPTIPWGIGSYAFDGEGVPAERKAIIEHGILRSYLHDSYTAGKAGVKSTGNSSRGGSSWTFRHPPSISSSNIVFSKGDSSLEEMIEETRKGIYLRITYDYPNLATGEFSGLMMESFMIDNGEIGASVQQSTLGIGLIDMLSRIDMIGKKQRDAFGARVPPIRISKARIGGSA